MSSRHLQLKPQKSLESRDMDVRIQGGMALIDGRLESASIHLDPTDGTIAEIGSDAGASCVIAGDGCIVLPGIVDIHGDAFERQLMPRPGVTFALDIALRDSDRQAIANGITTVFHGVTCSWEPGLRGPDNARAIVEALDSMQHELAADTRFHLRHETFNLEMEHEVLGWLADSRIGMMAFNDHLPSVDVMSKRPEKVAQMAERARLSHEQFQQLVDKVRERADEVPDSMRRLAAAAIASGVPLLSHDDASPQQRQWFRGLGCRLAEFPKNIETAEDAKSAGDDIVLGAPNVVRGGSHVGWINAAEMVSRGICTILASDYYYPAQLIAAFRLAERGVLPLEKAWSLISETPAAAARLSDRGRIAKGQRADLIIVDAQEPSRPQVVASIVAGRVVHLTDTDRLLSS